MASTALYYPRYEESRALVIGVDKYQHANPLMHAGNDARAVAETLVTRFSFPESNVELLLDGNATRDAIMHAFLRYADAAVVGENDRILVFFAGHGFTRTGRRGEIGYLVPADGKVDELGSLIRWDDLTRNADLVLAKHMLFLMDACYGGLALTRNAIPPGSMRFLKDMLQRYTRQVLTAGKADELVSDSGGTRHGHSIFTSYLLDGLEGGAIHSGGILTGHGLMAYVYDKVSKDPHSRQTPHFGFFEGDGDFIFDTSALAQLQTSPSQEPEPDLDVFIKAPTFSTPPSQQEETLADVLKRLIASPSEKIRLNDFISSLLRSAADRLSQNKFPPTGNDEVVSRIKRYEDAVADLVVAVILLAHYAQPEQVILIEKILTRVAEFDKPQAGTIVWIRLNWYPVLVLMYATGISALAANRFDALRAALLTPIRTPQRLLNQDTAPVVLPVVAELTEVIPSFKQLPDMERKYVPRSEHLYKTLQPVLEDQLFLGQSYDALFDQFEMLLALSFADLRDDDVTRHVWGPPGRFAWKERGRSGGDPVYSNFVRKVKAQGERWELLREGFFRGSAKRFSDVADAYANLLGQIAWW